VHTYQNAKPAILRLLTGRHIARILHWGGAQKLPGCTLFSQKKLTTFFGRRRQNLSYPAAGSISVAYLRPTEHFLIERTVLLYWIKQAIRPNKGVFLVKKSTQSMIGGQSPPGQRLAPTGYAPGNWKTKHTDIILYVSTLSKLVTAS